MRRTILAAAVFVAAISPAYAIDINKPDAYGYLSAGALKIEGQDAEAEAFELEVGLKGKATLDTEKTLDLHYAVEVDLANAANDADNRNPGGEADVHVKEAKFWLPTQYGMFVVAPRGTSGQWVDIYGPINHYEYNEPHSDLHPDGVFAQPDRTSGTFAYHTPRFMNTKLVAAAITLNDHNDQDVDGRAIRIVYDDGTLGMAAGTTILKQEQLPPFASDDYQITAAGARYRFDGLTVGAVWENDRNAPYALAPDGNADFDAYGVSANYVAESGLGFALGFKQRNHEYEEADETVYTLKVEQRLSDQVKVWAETGQYDNLPSNYAAGLSMTF